MWSDHYNSVISFDYIRSRRIIVSYSSLHYDAWWPNFSLIKYFPFFLKVALDPLGLDFRKLFFLFWSSLCLYLFGAGFSWTKMTSYMPKGIYTRFCQRRKFCPKKTLTWLLIRPEVVSQIPFKFQKQCFDSSKSSCWCQPWVLKIVKNKLKIIGGKEKQGRKTKKITCEINFSFWEGKRKLCLLCL